MTPESFLNNRVTLWPGDCLDALAHMEEGSVDSVVTDPPYHLTSIVKRFGADDAAPVIPGKTGAYARASAGFMGKKWDGGDIAFRPEVWVAVLRVLKPGGHLLAFGGTRTYHRLASAIDEAGFEVRDAVLWHYGAGFPKSHDVSKGIDRARDDKPDIHRVCAFVATARDTVGKTNREIDALFGFNGMAGHWTNSRGPQAQVPRWEQWLNLKDFIGFSDEMDAEVWRLNGRKGTPGEAWGQREVIGTREKLESWEYKGNNVYQTGGDLDRVTITETAPATDAARQWEGWGTALKPATEIICLARKPLSEGTVAANVLRHGTGALNIDGCRVGTDGGTKGCDAGPSNGILGDGLNGSFGKPVPGLGRWPANIITDGSEDVVAAFPESKSIDTLHPGTERGSQFGQIVSSARTTGYTDQGSAARFFYSAQPNEIEQVVITWISASEPHQATLLVDTGQLLGRATVASASKGGSGWSTFLSGSTLTELFRRASTCTIRTETSSTTGSRTWNYLISLLTSAFTGDVNYEAVIGGSHAESAASGAQSLIITLAETASLPGASPAALGTQLKISVNAASAEQISSTKRFHYSSKADADDRIGSVHPTVKPLDLMQYLCRLVTPPGGTVLDLFAGTGTTGEAAWREGFNAVLIEREEEYQADIRRRMKLALSGPDERTRESIKASGKAPGHDDLPLFAEPFL